MKLFALYALISLFVVGECGLLGAKECTYGPSYWCESIKNAKQCNAVKHCIQTVWEKQTLQEDNDDVCAMCKDMVLQAREQLLSNETQEEIRQVFDGSCRLIPIKVIQKECLKLSDEFIPELIDTLASQMNPQIVCATAGLCNSPRVDRLIKKYKAKHPDVSFGPVPHPKATPLPGDCPDCKKFITDVMNIVKRHSRAELLDHLLAICGRLSSLSDGCAALVRSNFEIIHRFLTQGLDPNDVCTLFGMCEGLLGASMKNTLVKTGDEPCDFCIVIVNNWRESLTANTTKEQFKMILDGICHNTGKFENECLSLVDQYFEPIYNILVSEIDPKMICTDVGLCGAHALFKVEVPSWYLEPTYLSERVPFTALHPAFKSDQLTGQDEANSYRHDKDLSRVSLSKSSVDIVVIGEKGILETDPQKSDICIMCEFTLHFIQNVLGDNQTREEIEESVESVCQYLPHSVFEECQDYIDAYGDQVIQLIILEIDPATICPMLNLCLDRAIGHSENTIPSTCILCEYVMTELDQIISDKSNEDAVKQAVDNVCTLMPKTVRNDCIEFVNLYIDQIVDYIINDVTPDKICMKLGLCAKSPLLLPLPSPGEAQLPLGRLFPSFLPTQDTVQNQRGGELKSQSFECVICEFIMTKLDEFLLQKPTEEKIEKAVQHVCLLLPNTLMKDCFGFLEQYADSLIELLVNNLDPSTVCKELDLCHPPDFQGLPTAMVEFPVDRCLICETVMSYVEEAETSNGSVTDFLSSEVCAHFSAVPEQACTHFVNNHGEYLGKLSEELKDNKRVCQALKWCLHLGNDALLGGKKCTWGPSYWCQTEIHARSCKATEHCNTKVWGKAKPSS